MRTEENGPQKLAALCQAVQDSLEADMFLLSGPMQDKLADDFITTLRSMPSRRPNAGIVLTTHGGSADAAYRIAQVARRQYRSVTLYVFGRCKSAGTLLALGAHKIVMSDFGELGPLDVQVVKQDEIASYNSGLDIVQALTTVGAQTYNLWEFAYLQITAGSQGAITTRTASEIAANLAVGVMSPISAQIDPLKLGEMSRANSIGRAYGLRLNGNHAAIDKLINGYPSHGYVIDLDEAREVLGEDVVRQPTEDERLMEGFLIEEFDSVVRHPAPTPVVLNLSRIAAEEGNDESPATDERSGTGSDAPADEGSAARPKAADESAQAKSVNGGAKGDGASRASGRARRSSSTKKNP